MATRAVVREWIFAAIGFLVAPLVPALAAALTFPVSGGVVKTDIALILRLTVFFYGYAAVVPLLVAVPLFLVFRRMRLIYWWSTALVGFGIGILMLGIVAVSSEAGFYPIATLLWGGGGALAAFVFWLIWRQGRST